MFVFGAAEKSLLSPDNFPGLADGAPFSSCL
jgi:hypothetical protein